MSTPGTDAALSHFLSVLDTCITEERQIQNRAAILSQQRTNLIAAIRCAIDTLEPVERAWWRTHLRARIGPDVTGQPGALNGSTKRMRLIRDWLRDEAPAPFRNANLKDAMARHGYEIKHTQIGTILTRLTERGEIEKVDFGTYRANLGHPALQDAT